MRRPLGVLMAVVTTVALAVLLAIPAWSMTLTFVRHAESQANADGVIDTSVPGPGLSDPVGVQQALDAAAALVGNGYDAVFASSMIRTQLTSQPLRDLLDPAVPYQILPGLREIAAGWFEGSSEDTGLGRLGYALAPVAWTLGARFVPVLGAQDGNAFDARVDEAVAAIYAGGAENAVAFSHGATIMFWVMMNVENPDLLLLLSHQLPNTGVVVIDGTPAAGWRLVSWDGVAVAAEPSLLTKLFVDVRDLVTAPQTALYDIGTAFASGDLGAVVAAVRDGVVKVVQAVVGFVPEVIRDVVDSVRTVLAPPTADAPATTLRASSEKVEDVDEFAKVEKVEKVDVPEPDEPEQQADDHQSLRRAVVSADGDDQQEVTAELGDQPDVEEPEQTDVSDAASDGSTPAEADAPAQEHDAAPDTGGADAAAADAPADADPGQQAA